MMEAESLKLMLDGIEESPTQLLLIDEILKGTNPEERLAASVVILNTLEKTEKVIVTTHDIGILEDLIEYEAFNLEHHVTDQAIVYDYDLKPGTSVYKNAIKIMTYLKYPKGLIEDINTYMFTEKGV
jgi:DNA mismatch repair ATPase MutS